MPFEPPPVPVCCTPRRLACIGALATLLVAHLADAQGSPPNPANKASAQAIFDQALVDMQAGRFEQACPAFANSLRLYRAPGTLFTLAECETKRGHIVTALERYDEYLAFYNTLPLEKKIAQEKESRPNIALAQKAALTPQVPKLAPLLPQNAPAQLLITVDGREISRPTVGTVLLVDPGEHTLTTQVPGGPVTETRVTLGKGERREVELNVKLPAGSTAALPPAAPSTTAPPPAAPSTAVPPPAPTSTPAQPTPTLAKSPASLNTEKGGSHTGAYVVGGIGLASLLVGGITGGLMLADKGVVDANCTDGSVGVKLCKTPASVDAGNQAKTLGLVSTIGFGAGIAGLGVATILLLTEPSSSKQTSTRGPTRPREPQWSVSAGPISDPRAGAMLRVQGVW